MWIAEAPGHCFGKFLLLTRSVTKNQGSMEKNYKKFEEKKREGFGDRMFCLPFDYIQLLEDKGDTENVARG